MEAEAARFGWRWVLAAVGADDAVVILDPAKAKRGQEVRVAAEAEIANLPKWVDGGESTLKREHDKMSARLPAKKEE